MQNVLGETLMQQVDTTMTAVNGILAAFVHKKPIKERKSSSLLEELQSITQPVEVINDTTERQEDLDLLLTLLVTLLQGTSIRL